jgi:hypothetical protein
MFDEPLQFVVPMIRATLTERPEGEDVRRRQLPEVAVMADCREQFGEEGLNQLTIGLPVAAAAAVHMRAAALKAQPATLPKQLAADMAIEHAITDPGPDVMWEHVANIVLATILGDPTHRPAVEDVLFEVQRKRGTDGLLDLLICIAQFTAGVVREMGSAAMHEEIMRLVGKHVDAAGSYLRSAKIVK